jgi:hypothetical protein
MTDTLLGEDTDDWPGTMRPATARAMKRRPCPAVQQVSVIDSPAFLLERQTQVSRQRRVIAIDGRGGAGTSTLVERVRGDRSCPWTDAPIWVQGDLDEQDRRLTARDGNSAAQQHHIAEWLKEELPLLLREQPWRKATTVVAGTTDLIHDPHTEIVTAASVPA